MKIKSLAFLTLTVLTFLVYSCAEEPEDVKSAFISGTVTVDEDLDPSGDYSGIHLFIPAPNRMSGERDTLFHAVTDSLGEFSGSAEMDKKEIYTMIVSRNRNTFGAINLVLADGDSITFQAKLPNVNESTEVTSRENDVLQTFNRVDRSFARVAQYIRSGAMSVDSVSIELNKWSDIYWEIYENNPGTYAAQLAGETSLSILSGMNDSLMIEKANIVLDDYKRLLPNTKQLLLNYHANEQGLDGALTFLDRLFRVAPDKSELISLEIDRIELLYDSSQTNQANQHLTRFKDQFSDDSLAMEWAKNVSYDLEFLAPGSPFPPFEFQTVFGDSISTETLQGKPFLIEVTRLDNQMYQEQYDRTIAIYQIYRNFGLEIITVPLGATPVMFEAFFDERDILWNFAQPYTFDNEEVIELLNINRLPTRFLVNRDGTIIRRYVGNEYQDVVRGLQQITTQN